MPPVIAPRGSLMILSAPSGAGKSSLARALAAARDDVVISVSHTTRAPRPGERDGVDYFFVDRDTFQDMVRREAFVEHAEVFGNLYGTSREAIEADLAAGRHVLLDIDWQGARRVRALFPAAVSVFILPPSRQALLERLRGRGQDSEEVIAGRMARAEAEMSHAPEFDYVVENDLFEAALADLQALLDGEPRRLRPRRTSLEALLEAGAGGVTGGSKPVE